MKIILLSLIMISFILVTAMVFVYLIWGIGRLFRIQYMDGYQDTQKTLRINKYGELLCAVYAPFVFFLLTAIFL